MLKFFRDFAWKCGTARSRVWRFFARRQWLKEGALMLEYPGYHCGICGAWIPERFFLPAYRSDGEWQDTVGRCPKHRSPDEPKTWQEIVGWN